MQINRSLIRRGDAERDSQFLWLAFCEFRPGSIRDRRRIRITWKTSSDRVEIGGGVPHRPCVAKRISATMPDVASWTGCQPAARRFQSNDPTAGCGHANRSGRVSRLGDRNHARSDGGCRATARAASGYAPSPRVERGAVELWFGGKRPAVFGRIGFANEKKACRLDAFDHLRIGVRPNISEIG